MSERAKEITTAVAAHGHKRVGLVTFTLRHARGNSLYVLRRLLTDAYAELKAGRGGMALRLRSRYVGDIRGSEVTHGASGWHPHLHALWFVGGKLDAQKLERELVPAWAAAVERVWVRFEQAISRGIEGTLSEAQARKIFGSRYTKDTDVHSAAAAFARAFETLGTRSELIAPSDAHGVDVRPCTGTGAYIAKMGLEVSRIVGKRGKSQASRTSWEVAQDAADGDLQSKALWAEHARDMFGARQLTWSRGLRAALGMTIERSDEEIAADPPEQDERQIGTIEAGVWDARARELGQAWLSRLHDAHATGQLLAIEGVVKATTAWDAKEKPPIPPRPQWWELWRADERGKGRAPKKPQPRGTSRWMSRAEREEWREEVRHSLADHGIMG